MVALERGQFAQFTLLPGRYTLTSEPGRADLRLEAGQRRYVRCRISPGSFKGRAELELVDETTFLRDAAELQEKIIPPPPDMTSPDEPSGIHR